MPKNLPIFIYGSPVTDHQIDQKAMGAKYSEELFIYTQVN